MSIIRMNIVKFQKIFFISLIFSIIISCHTTVIQSSSDSDSTTKEQTVVPVAANAEPVYDEALSSLWFGIQENFETEYVTCPKGVSKVTVTRNLVDNIIHFFVGFAYTTKHIIVDCK